jgi:uncharacterized CHY-type Zn-finger protein
MREYCISCSKYMWAPKLPEPKKYYHCNHCHKDILCERGLSISYKYFENNIIEKKVKCSRCGEVLTKHIWPPIPESLKRELLKKTAL